MRNKCRRINKREATHLAPVFSVTGGYCSGHLVLYPSSLGEWEHLCPVPELLEGGEVGSRRAKSRPLKEPGDPVGFGEGRRVRRQIVHNTITNAVGRGGTVKDDLTVPFGGAEVWVDAAFVVSANFRAGDGFPVMTAIRTSDGLVGISGNSAESAHAVRGREWYSRRIGMASFGKAEEISATATGALRSLGHERSWALDSKAAVTICALATARSSVVMVMTTTKAAPRIPREENIFDQSLE